MKKACRWSMMLGVICFPPLLLLLSLAVVPAVLGGERDEPVGTFGLFGGTPVA